MNNNFLITKIFEANLNESNVFSITHVGLNRGSRRIKVRTGSEALRRRRNGNSLVPRFYGDSGDVV